MDVPAGIPILRRERELRRAHISELAVYFNVGPERFLLDSSARGVRRVLASLLSICDRLLPTSRARAVARLALAPALAGKRRSPIGPISHPPRR